MDGSFNQFLSYFNKQVTQHFKEKPSGTFANTQMLVKIYLLGLLIVIAYACLFFISPQEFIIPFTLIYLILQGAVFFLNINVAHDAVHQALFSKRKWNDRLYTLAFSMMGSSPFIWKKNHLLHHKVPNIIGYDNDVIETPLLRLNTYQKKRSFHKLQYVYAPILYLIHYPVYYYLEEPYRTIRNSFPFQLNTKRRLHVGLLKIIHFSVIVILPAWFWGYSLWVIVVLHIVGLSINSLLLVLVIGIPHINESAEFYNKGLPGEEYSWTQIQVMSSTNFNNNGSVSHWIWGGFNNHIMHHLLPHVCHIHYRTLNPILYSSAKKFGLSLNTKSYVGLLKSHFRLLRSLGSE